jgi:hypothetical protein
MRYGYILLAKVCDKLCALLDVLLLFGINLHNNTPTFRAIHQYYKRLRINYREQISEYVSEFSSQRV